MTRFPFRSIDFTEFFLPTAVETATARSEHDIFDDFLIVFFLSSALRVSSRFVPVPCHFLRVWLVALDGEPFFLRNETKKKKMVVHFLFGFSSAVDFLFFAMDSLDDERLESLFSADAVDRPSFFLSVFLSFFLARFLFFRSFRLLLIGVSCGGRDSPPPPTASFSWPAATTRNVEKEKKKYTRVEINKVKNKREKNNKPQATHASQQQQQQEQQMKSFSWFSLSLSLCLSPSLPGPFFRSSSTFQSLRDCYRVFFYPLRRRPPGVGASRSDGAGVFSGRLLLI